MRTSRIPALAAAASLALLVLSGCSSTVVLEPAPDANNPDCAEVSVRLPQSVEGLEKRRTNAQATAAWGEPASVLLYCGVEVPSASTTRCIQVNDLYWLVDGDDAPTYILTSYGREPAIDVVIDTSAVASTPVLVALTRAVAENTEPNGHACTDIDDSQRIDTEN